MAYYIVKVFFNAKKKMSKFILCTAIKDAIWRMGEENCTAGEKINIKL
jgi:hypothetical protein